MDAALRRSQREGDRLGSGQWLLRAGRVDEALDAFEAAWSDGPPAASAEAAARLLERLRALPPSLRPAHAARIDRLARAGLAAAAELRDEFFPAARSIVGGSPGAVALRSFLFEQAGRAEPVLLWGEAGVGHTLAARTLHALSRRGSFHELYGPRGAALLHHALRGAAPGGTLYVSYAAADQDWEESARAACAARGLRLVVGAVADARPPILEGLPALRIPPLRERFEDLEELLAELLRRAGAPGAAQRISRDDLRRLRWHDWPGNVRELAHHVGRAVLEGEGADEVRERLLGGLFGLPGAVGEGEGS